jgi:hypothetical protein
VGSRIYIISSMVKQQSLCLLACAVALVSLGGCSSGEPIYPVTGRIIFADGKPVPGGIIEFQAIDGGSKANPRGTIGVEGKFNMITPPEREGAVTGMYRAIVRAFDPAYNDEAHGFKIPPPLIDRRYEKYETTDLEVLVEPKANEVTITVERPH